jgi:hypothetical protein
VTVTMTVNMSSTIHPNNSTINPNMSSTAHQNASHSPPIVTSMATPTPSRSPSPTSHHGKFLLKSQKSSS